MHSQDITPDGDGHYHDPAAQAEAGSHPVDGHEEPLPSFETLRRERDMLFQDLKEAREELQRCEDKRDHLAKRLDAMEAMIKSALSGERPARSGDETS